MPTALAPLRIVDFSRVLAGPFATMMLADFGAEVTKVERPGVGDETRSWGPPYDERGEATYFQSVNRNKAGVAIDMGSDEGLAELRRRAREADVLVENFRPGLMAAKGLDHETLRAENPRLIYCSITGFGGSGEGAELPGYDLLVQGLAGLMSITGRRDGEPGAGADEHDEFRPKSSSRLLVRSPTDERRRCRRRGRSSGSQW